MPARTLLTIGDLRASPLSRQAQRRARVQGLSHIDPTRYSERFDIGSADSNTGGDALQNASMAMLNAFDLHGATASNVYDPIVETFQRAWNADPANGGDQLGVDGKYGPLTYGAFKAMVGAVAQPVNGGVSPAVVPPAVVVAPGSGDSQTGSMLLILAAVGVAGYLLFFRKKRSSHHHAHHGSVVEIKSNPRRRARRTNSLIV